jgi:hypothetical protein
MSKKKKKSTKYRSAQKKKKRATDKERKETVTATPSGPTVPDKPASMSGESPPAPEKNDGKGHKRPKKTFKQRSEQYARARARLNLTGPTIPDTSASTSIVRLSPPLQFPPANSLNLSPTHLHQHRSCGFLLLCSFLLQIH